MLARPFKGAGKENQGSQPAGSRETKDPLSKESAVPKEAGLGSKNENSASGRPGHDAVRGTESGEEDGVKRTIRPFTEQRGEEKHIGGGRSEELLEAAW